MNPRGRLALALVASLAAVPGAHADGVEETAQVSDGDEPEVRAVLPLDATFPPPPVRLRRSTLRATAEILGVNAMFSLIALAAGKDYVKISPRSIWDNLTGEWVWDEDAFVTNQFGHPYLGSLMYTAARANGLGVGGASLATFIGSAFWELVMETETPSINDQIFTPVGGILLGEVLHRFGRAILWDGDPRPRGRRLVLSTLVDPVGMFNRAALGEAWEIQQPPAMFGYVAAGWNGLSADFAAPTDRFTRELAQLRLSVGLTYGIPTHASFQPRQPMDHFEITVDGSLAPDDTSFAIHTRGLLWGRAFTLGRAHAVGGLFGGYDFENPERIRIGAASLGLGATLHLPLGARSFFQATGVASAIPFGAAGGGVDEDQVATSERDYHRGPGSTQSTQLRLGRRGLGALYLDSRNFEIDGAYFDEGSEVISLTRIGGQLAVLGRHGLAVEAQLSVRRAKFDDRTRDVLDTSAQLRVLYVLFQDRTFGGGAGP